MVKLPKKFNKFSLIEKSYKENGKSNFKTIVEKVVPDLEVAIKIANVIIDIYERAKINGEICRIMTDRVELAMTSVK
jgi:hypothetical protein